MIMVYVVVQYFHNWFEFFSFSLFNTHHHTKDKIKPQHLYYKDHETVGPGVQFQLTLHVITLSLLCTIPGFAGYD